MILVADSVPILRSFIVSPSRSFRSCRGGTPYIYMCYIGAQPTQIVILKILLVCSPLFAQVVVHYLWAREQEFLRASPIKEIWVFYFCNLFHFCIVNFRSYIFNKMMKMH